MAEFGAIANNLLPIENLVPESYADWRPFVRTAFAYIVSHLSLSRMVPKLIDLLIQSDRSLEKRFVSFISEMPTLQKLGQVIARNRELDPSFKQELIYLENSIRDIEPQIVFEEIRAQLGSKIEEYSIEFEEVLHSEASVGAVVRFSFLDAELGKRRDGVFKVLKPNVSGYFWEEISIWDGFITHLDNARESMPVNAIDLRGIINDIREHLAPELDYRNEQTHLLKAKASFSSVANIRIPEIFSNLCSQTITAMSFERGTKIADAYPSSLNKRREIADRLIELYIAQPLCNSHQTSFIHADPHAGNILVDESNGDIILLDWALVEYLQPEDRHQILMLVTALLLRDESILINALLALSSEKNADHAPSGSKIQAEVRRAIQKMPIAGLPELHHATDLVDRLGMLGVRFEKSFLVYRKTLLTLDGVLHSLDKESRIAPSVSQYASEVFARSLIHLQPSPLSFTIADTANLLLSLSWLGTRLQLNLAQRIWSPD